MGLLLVRVVDAEQFLAGGRVPEADGAVARDGGQAVAAAVEAEGGNRPLVPGETADFPAGLHVHEKNVVLVVGGQGGAVGREDDLGVAAGRGLVAAKLFAGGGVPNDCRASAAGDEDVFGRRKDGGAEVDAVPQPHGAEAEQGALGQAVAVEIGGRAFVGCRGGGRWLLLIGGRWHVGPGPFPLGEHGRADQRQRGGGQNHERGALASRTRSRPRRWRTPSRVAPPCHGLCGSRARSP